MLRPSFRTVMVSITFYDGSINVLDNPWQKHLNRNQIIEKQQFSPKSYSNNSVHNTTKCTVFGIVMVSISFYAKNINYLVISY